MSKKTISKDKSANPKGKKPKTRKESELTLSIVISDRDKKQLDSLKGLALKAIAAILKGNTDASSKEILDAIKLVLSRTLPERLFLEDTDAREEKESAPPLILGVKGLDTNRI